MAVSFDKNKTVLAEGAIVLNRKGKLKPVAKKEAPSSKLKVKPQKDGIGIKWTGSF